MSVGSYTGNATAGHSVTGVGFSPELVYVLGSGATSPVFRSSADTDTFGFSLGGATANGVTALGSDGFTVGTGNTVNGNGTVYHYVAWNGVPGLMDVGSYSGTGADNRNITGLGFQPELTVVKSDDSTNKTAVLHADAHGSLDDESMWFDKLAALWDPNLIQQLQADGFQVGTDDNVNKNNGTYSYMAWRQQTPPTISAIANQSTDEDTATPAIAFTVGDAETAAASLAVSGSSSNQALVPDANIVFGGSGANRTVTITPAANQSGSVTITLKVTDDFSEATRTFTLTVNPVNDAPVNTRARRPEHQRRHGDGVLLGQRQSDFHCGCRHQRPLQQSDPQRHQRQPDAGRHRRPDLCRRRWQRRHHDDLLGDCRRYQHGSQRPEVQPDCELQRQRSADDDHVRLRADSQLRTTTDSRTAHPRATAY